MRSIVSLVCITFLLSLTFDSSFGERTVRSIREGDLWPLRGAVEDGYDYGSDDEYDTNKWQSSRSFGSKITIRFLSLVDGRHRCPELQSLGQKLLKDREFCDLEINVVDRRTNDTQVFCAHRAILALRSTSLRARVNDALKGGSKGVLGLPVINWPDMDPAIFKHILEYIYTGEIDPKFDRTRNIIGLYVAAYLSGLSDLTEIIEEYLFDAANTIEQLHDLVYYLRWAHKKGYSGLKKFLLAIARKILKLSPKQWDRFVRDLCESAEHESTIPVPKRLLPDWHTVDRPPIGGSMTGGAIIGGSMTGGSIIGGIHNRTTSSTDRVTSGVDMEISIKPTRVKSERREERVDISDVRDMRDIRDAEHNRANDARPPYDDKK